MLNYLIETATKEDCNFLDDKIIEFNAFQVPFTQSPEFVSINKVMKNEEGQIICGILGLMYCWNCLYIDILWVDERYRSNGVGGLLIEALEIDAKEKGAKLVHLDTFDFQAKAFYLKKGYQIFGELSDCPEGHTRYYMSKRI